MFLGFSFVGLVREEMSSIESVVYVGGQETEVMSRGCIFSGSATIISCYKLKWHLAQFGV